MRRGRARSRACRARRDSGTHHAYLEVICLDTSQEPLPRGPAQFGSVAPILLPADPGQPPGLQQHHKQSHQSLPE